jgi:hypothetical protein
MKNLLSNKTLQATYGGDVIGGSVVRGNAWGVFIYQTPSKAVDIDVSQDRQGYSKQCSKQRQIHAYRPSGRLRATINNEGIGNH